MRFLLFLSICLLMACKSTQQIPTKQPVLSPDQIQKNIVTSTVSKSEILSHLQFLASDELRGRNMPSPELKIAAEYLKTQMMFFGVDTIAGHGSYKQTVPFRKESPPTSSSLVIGENTYSFAKDFIVVGGKDIELDAMIVFVDGAEIESISEDKVKGKIVISPCGDGKEENPQAWFGYVQEKNKILASKGALAVIEIYQSTQMPWTFVSRRMSRAQTKLDETMGEDTGIAHLWMSAPEGAEIDALKTSKTKGSVMIEGLKRESVESYNVIGYVEGTDPTLKDEFIIYSAHYDHVGVGGAGEDTIFNGARDNAVGTTAVLTAAQNIAAHPTKRSSLFILWTAEEKGLLGSRWFVDHSPIPLDKIAYCFNIDNGGYNDTSIVSVVGLTRTTAEPHLQKGCNAFGLTAIEDPAKEQGLFDRSDNVNFARKGVPAPTFSLGFTAFDEEIMKYYHQPADEVESLDMDYITKYCKAFVLSGRLIADDPAMPFWNPGDKYYDVGKSLYGNE